MDKNIIDSLIICKQDFDKKFEDFAFKQDFEAVFKHEYENYVSPICERIVPLLSKHLKENPQISITNYYPYIVTKYHDIIKKEVLDYEKNTLNMIKNIGNKLKEQFLAELMQNSKKTEEEKLQFLNSFFKENSHFFGMLIKSDPLQALKTCAELRNPVMQNLIISNFSGSFKKLIESKNQESFNRDILPLFIYPVDISAENYYKKWISKDAIHVKFSKNILGNYYEFSKKELKNQERLKRQDKINNS